MTDYVTRIDNFIASLGIEAYRVGGSVRDELIGRRVKDADYMVRGVTLAHLGELLDDAGRHIDGYSRSKLKLRDGRQVGHRVAAKGMGCIEIVLPRKEVSTGPGRHDFEIVVDPFITLEEDAKRRDFTFNALYRPVRCPSGGVEVFLTDDGRAVADPTGRGLHDLERRLIHTTYPDSFRDDPLRTLRALRFVSQGFDLTAATLEQMREHAPAVDGLTAAGYASGTAFEELTKILMGDNVAHALRTGFQAEVLQQLVPELAEMVGFDQGSRYHDLTTDEHTLAALEVAAHVDAPLRVRLALLFHDSGKPEAAWVGKDGRKHYYASPRDQIDPDGNLTDELWEFVKTEDHEIVGERLWRSAAKRLNVPKAMREDVATLIRHHMVPINPRSPEVRVRRWRVMFGDTLLRDLLMHRMCDLSAKGRPSMAAVEKVAGMAKIADAARDAGVPASTAELKINGHDVKALGLDGRRVGEVLDAVLDEVVCRPDIQTLTREWQLRRAEALAR